MYIQSIQKSIFLAEYNYDFKVISYNFKAFHGDENSIGDNKKKERGEPVAA